MAIQLMVVDQDVNYIEEVKQYFKNSSSIVVNYTFKNLEEASKHVNDCDVLLLDMLLNGMDSVSLLQKFKRENKDGIVIATSPFVSGSMMEIISENDVNFFLKKPFTNEILESLVNSLYNKKHKNDSGDNELKMEITNMLHMLGIPSHIRGYSYIRDGVEMLYKDSSLMGSITKSLYPNIAENYDTTSSRVERAIRHAIEVSWIRGDYKIMEKLFGNSVDFDRSKPTNSEFIATLADRLKLENKFA